MDTAEIISSLKKLIGPQAVLSGVELSQRYFHIWEMDKGLKAIAVCLPHNSEDVSHILGFCNKNFIPVVVHGGLTNLVGGTETSGNEIVISLDKMNQIIEVDENSRSITVEAGVILEKVQEAAAESDLMFPLNFGAKGSAQMGGVISSNAGGLRVFKYGMTRNQVLGLEAVLADGTIISSLKKIIKDNSAYDLKHLFVGSEGTLGVVTKAVLKLVEKPTSRISAFVGFNNYSRVVEFLRFLDKGLAGILSGYELILRKSYEEMTSERSGRKPPLPYEYEYYVLFEVMGANVQNDTTRVELLLEEALNAKMIEDAVIANNQSDLNWFWSIREDVHVLVSACTFDQHFDVSLPTPLIGDYARHVEKELLDTPKIEHVFGFGHIADGNLHFIVGKENDSDNLRLTINEVVYSPLKELHGSVSAEHGIGVHKKAYLKLSRSEEEINLMKKLKLSLDPHKILNPGKVLDLD